MKKQLIAFVLGIVVTSLVGFKVLDYEVRKSTAEVERYQGYYIYTDSKPVQEYTYLGTVKVSTGWSGQYEPVRDGLIKKALKEYPKADGLILNLKDGGADKADVILFKD